MAHTLNTQIETVKRALDAAFLRGITRPKLRVHRFTFTRAPDTGKNPGAVYVKGDGFTYLGKIDGYGFRSSRDCTTEDETALAEIAADPLTAAREHGKLTGACSCCGRRLSDPVSLQNGIGPICQQQFFS